MGCACHAFHLLIQDISIEVSQRLRPFSYKGQRLENTFNLVSGFVTIFKTERFSFDINAELKQNKLRALVKPVLTRWAYCYYCVLFFYNAREIVTLVTKRVEFWACHLTALVKILQKCFYLINDKNY